MEIDTLLHEARKTWGNDTKLTLEEILVCIGVVFGDLSRQARTRQEGGHIDNQELKKEMGNLIYSLIRWCDDLGYDPKDCIAIAQHAQAAYNKRTQSKY